MDNPLISIITPVYNTEKYLNKCIQSILQQEFGNFELILVDDGSTDGSRRIINDWASKDWRIQPLYKENGGQSSARNMGLDQAKGVYISFVDSDDFIESDYLSYLLSLFVSNCKVTVCNHFVERGNHKTANSKSKDRLLSKEEAFEEVLFHGCIDVAPWAKLYKHEVFQTLRFPEGRIFEDTWLFGDILNQTDSVAFGSRCCYNYLVHEQSTVTKKYSERNLQYIEAAKKLALDAMKCDPDMKTGAIRRINHARMSVLRYMEDCEHKDWAMRSEIRNEILKDAPSFINHPRTPKRDQMAIKLLKLGLHPFYTGWRLYSLMR